MNLKEMSNEELLNTYDYSILEEYPADTLNYIKDELLSRLGQIDNLKCCGNCKACCVDDIDICPFPFGDSCSYCDKWQSDGMTRKDRMIK